MTAQTILLLMAVAAILVGFGAAGFGLSPWFVFGAAWIPTAVVVVLGQREMDRPCSTSGPRDPAGLFETATVMSATLFAAAAVAAVADGVRLAMQKEYGSALGQVVGCTLGGVVGVAVVFYSILGAGLHCD